jgi:hypothetical protein
MSLCLLTLLLAAAPARASAQVLASVSARVPISSYGGWVAWSQQRASAWDLMSWHDGALARVPVAPREQPFDVDLGPDPRGRVVATFSRCDVAPPAFFDGTFSPWLGDGCRVRVVDLLTGRERAVRIPRPVWSSDTSPSMWRGRIAFARNVHGGRVSQVMLWSPASRRLTTLRHGAIPTNCPVHGGCKGAQPIGAVQGLDLGARLLAFRWWVEAPAVVGNGGWEVRADRIASDRSTLVGSGFIGEACTGGTDLSVPSQPVVHGDRVWYSQLDANCYQWSSTLARFGVATSKLGLGSLSGIVEQASLDGTGLYALVSHGAQGEYTAEACGPGPAQCTIERVELPTLHTTPAGIHPPFF